MNQNNMGGMNPMGGGPVGGGMPMMNNGAGARPPLQANMADQRAQLNTYIYEYFLKNNMYDCARSLVASDQPINVQNKSPGQNGDDGGDGSSKGDDPKRHDDLPTPNLPTDCEDSCFLYEWWCLFWDMFNAQRGKGERQSVMAYVNHTQNQSRQRQEQQAQVLRNMRNDVAPQNYQQMMMRPGPNGMSLQQQELRKNAIMANRQQNITPQHAQMLAQQQKANQMQRVPSDGNNQRPQSPGSAENAPSPSKKPRLDAAAFNPQQGMPNGRGQMQGMPQQQFQVPGGANPAQQARLAGYQAGLAQQQAGQMPNKPMPNQGGPPNQGSPMMAQGPADGNLANYYNPTDMGANGMRGPAGAQGAGTGNHALQDYQMQLMLLEQQNKKRLMMARQEQDSMTLPRGADGAPGAQPMGPNGQPFQGASPGARNSPNPTDAIKRTPHMNPGSIPSPIPDGQNRGSPGSMNFNNMPGNPMDPNNMNPKFYQMNGGMDPNMVAANMQNGMRPPSSHPGGFNPLAQQQMQMQQAQRQQVAVAQQQAQQQQANGQNWVGPNGQQMVSQPSQGAPQQNIGTPRQQNQMPPPSAPAGAVANGRTQPSSPQSVAAPPTPNQANKANPKKKPDAKDTKAKRATKKGSAANLNAGATPSADAPTDGPTPTPQTPITPSHNKFGGQNGAVQPPTNGQPPAPPANPGLAVAQQQPEQMPNFGGMNDYAYDGQLAFSDPVNGNMDVLQDFDFDSFLHQDGDVGDNFQFDNFAMDDGGQIGAE